MEAATAITTDFWQRRKPTPHEKAEMEFVQKTPVKSKRTNHHRNGFNVWLKVFKCPVCGARRAPLANLSRGKQFFCTGTEKANY